MKINSITIYLYTFIYEKLIRVKLFNYYIFVYIYI